jgi:hypothetical protein
MTERGRPRAFDPGVTEGDLPPGTGTADLAGFYATILFGLSIRARDGSSLTELQRSIDRALAAWPATPRGQLLRRVFAGSQPALIPIVVHPLSDSLLGSARGFAGRRRWWWFDWLAIEPPPPVGIR